MLLIMTLVGSDLLLSLLKVKFKTIDKATEGTPLIIVDKGKPLSKRMKCCRVEEEDILQAARQTQGLARMDQIKYAVFEIDGSISIIPFSS
jgi:uncharacterized membrane protein YcaP (DUF421 family)